EAFDSADHDRPIAADGAEQAGEQQLERVVALLLWLGLGKLPDGGGRLLERDAPAGKDRDELSDLVVAAPCRQVVDRRTIPHLRRGQRRDLALDARPVLIGGLRREGARAEQG